MNNIFQIISAVVILAVGIWIGTLFKGCGTSSKSVMPLVDTLVIDTSKIIYKTPIIIKQITTQIIDSVHDCWSSLPATVTERGDTVSIGRVNSCKGLYEGVRVGYKPDTVYYSVAKIIRDTVREVQDFKFPSLIETTGSIFNFSIMGKVGSGFGMVAGAGIDFNASYGRVGLNVSPSLYYLDKFRGFVFIGATYKLIGK